MNDEIKHLPGIEATRKWLEANGVKPYRFALNNGIDPKILSRLLNNQGGVSLETAVKIERGTNGEVKAEMFVKESE